MREKETRGCWWSVCEWPSGHVCKGDLWVTDKCESSTLTVSITEAWCEGTGHVRTQEQEFHHPRARWEKKSPQRHTVTLSWPCPNVLIGKGAAWKNTGNPVLYHTLKKKKNISQSKGSTLSGWGSPVGMVAVEQCHPCHHNKSFSLLQRQIHPHDMLGWAEEFPSQSYKYFQWIQCGQWLTKPSKWTQLHWNMPAWFKRAVTTYH